jgi:hypothetical protein
MSTELLTIIIGAIIGGSATLFTIRVVINKSRKNSSKQIAKAGDDADIDQKQIHVEGDYHHHEAPKNEPDSTETAMKTEILGRTIQDLRRPPLSEEECNLLVMIEPGEHFLIIKTFSKHCVVYGMPKGPLAEFLDRDDPMVAPAYIEALQSLVHRGLIKKTKDKYTLTIKGKAKRMLMQDSG